MKKLRITVEGKVYEVEVEIVGSSAAVAPVAAVAAAPAPVAAAPVAAPAPVATAPVAVAGANDVVCPLAATVVAVNVKEGQAVKAGDLLVTLEAMKMSTPINADSDGTVTKIHVAAGQSVQEGQPMVSLA